MNWSESWSRLTNPMGSKYATYKNTTTISRDSDGRVSLRDVKAMLAEIPWGGVLVLTGENGRREAKVTNLGSYMLRASGSTFEGNLNDIATRLREIL